MKKILLFTSLIAMMLFTSCNNEGGGQDPHYDGLPITEEEYNRAISMDDEEYIHMNYDDLDGIKLYAECSPSVTHIRLCYGENFIESFYKKIEPDTYIEYERDKEGKQLEESASTESEFGKARNSILNVLDAVPRYQELKYCKDNDTYYGPVVYQGETLDGKLKITELKITSFIINGTYKLNCVFTYEQITPDIK